MAERETYSYFWVPGSHYITYAQTNLGDVAEEITLSEPINTETTYLVEIEYTTGNTFGRDKRIYRDCAIFSSLDDANLFMDKYCIHYHFLKYRNINDPKKFSLEKKELLQKNHNFSGGYFTSLEDYFSSPVGTNLYLLKVVKDPSKMAGLIRKGSCGL